ncbi:MAG: ATP-binding protein [Pseudomonadota bacterium]
MSFRLKTVLGIAFIEALLLTILVISGLNYLSSSNAAQLQQRGATTAKLVATMTGDAVIAVDLATLDVLVDQALRNPDLVYLRIRSSNGTVLSEGGAPEALAASFAEDRTIEHASSDRRLDVSAPITVAGSTFGRVELGLSTAILDSTFGDALVWMVGIALAEMLLVALLGLALGHYLTRQLMMLKGGAKQVASGDFGYQIPIEGRDELAETAESFNSMSKALARYAEIADSARRTAEAGRELAESTLQDALDSMRDHVLVIGDDGRVLLANHSYRDRYGVHGSLLDAEGAFASEAPKNEEPTADYVARRRRQLAAPERFQRWEAKLVDGHHLLIAQHPMSRGGVVVVQTDVSELYRALEKNRQLQRELIQRQKSEAIGTLAGGLAHEINTPVQIIADNAGFVAEAVNEIVDLVDGLPDSASLKGVDLAKRLEAIDWTFVRDEIPQALSDMAEGTKRVRDLIETFKQFAKPEGTAVSLIDVVDVVTSVIDDTRHVWAPVAEVRTEFADHMPQISCQADQVKQVIRHLIVNAVHAIEDRGPNVPGLITVRLLHDQERVLLDIDDNGCGIPEENLDRIYDVLFTTKEPGRGSGQGLALAQMFVTRGLGGQISVDSEVGKGTRFRISLPLVDEALAAAGIN